MAYTSEGIMGQVWVAFGQGTGAMRVEHDAALALRDYYLRFITPTVLQDWDQGKVQALEKLRAVGRMAAVKAATRGDTTINAADVTSSATAVSAVAPTDWCPPLPPAP